MLARSPDKTLALETDDEVCGVPVSWTADGQLYKKGVSLAEDGGREEDRDVLRDTRPGHPWRRHGAPHSSAPPRKREARAPGPPKGSVDRLDALKRHDLWP